MAARLSCLADWLDGKFGISAAERVALGSLDQVRRQARRGSAVRRENDRSNDLMVVRSGRFYSAVLLPDGNRQILQFFFPGDIIGLADAAFGRSLSSVIAVTDGELCIVERPALRAMLATQPRIASIFLTLAQVEQVALADRLATIGRLAARARVAALLSEILVKCRRDDPTAHSTINLGLTQEEIGDATGLTAVHVNRMLRILSEEGFIARNNSLLHVLNEAGLRSLGNYVDRSTQLDPAWLPPRPED